MSDLRLENLVFLDRGPYTFTFRGGECCGISGGSGSGKTLLLRVIADLDPHAGKIFLGNLECGRTFAPEWRRRVGMLPAESSWWYEHVGDHFSQPDHELELRLGQLGFRREVLGWDVRRLSTGEKQRLALLRMLANNPQALLLDEPTASLDAANTTRVENLLGEYCREMVVPMLWVSHNEEQLERVADRRLTMQSGGRLTAEGEQ